MFSKPGSKNITTAPHAHFVLLIICLNIFLASVSCEILPAQFGKRLRGRGGPAGGIHHITGTWRGGEEWRGEGADSAERGVSKLLD